MTLCRAIKIVAWALAWATCAVAHPRQQVVDLPSRPGVTQRMLVLAPAHAPRAAVVLLAGGHGGLGIAADGSLQWGRGNFLMRSRQLFVDQGFVVAVVDAPSDRQSPPHLGGFRQTPEHAADLRAVIAWLRQQAAGPVWLVGTSRGTQSAAYVATELSGAEGPDGVVLSATVLTDRNSRAVPAMPVERIRVPVLLVHHEQDGCRACPFAEVPVLMRRLENVARKQVLSFTGGRNEGDPCEARAYHGFNGLEPEVVAQMAAWMLAK
jgi:dienelactone hydrolase